jgi:hypothetical protein
MFFNGDVNMKNIVAICMSLGLSGLMYAMEDNNRVRNTCNKVWQAIVADMSQRARQQYGNQAFEKVLTERVQEAIREIGIDDSETLKYVINSCFASSLSQETISHDKVMTIVNRVIDNDNASTRQERVAIDDDYELAQAVALSFQVCEQSRTLDLEMQTALQQSIVSAKKEDELRKTLVKSQPHRVPISKSFPTKAVTETLIDCISCLESLDPKDFVLAVNEEIRAKYKNDEKIQKCMHTVCKPCKSKLEEGFYPEDHNPHHKVIIACPFCGIRF